MGCVSSKVVEGSDLESESNRSSKTSKSTSEKPSKTIKSSEIIKSKDTSKDKKPSSESSKKRSTSEKTSISDGKSVSITEKSIKSSKSGERTGSSGSKHSSSKHKSSKPEDKKSKSSSDKSSKSHDKRSNSSSSSQKTSISKNSSDNDRSVKKSSAQRVGSSNHKHGVESDIKSRKLSKSSDSSTKSKSETPLKGKKTEIISEISVRFGEKDSKIKGDKVEKKKNVVNFTPTPRPNKTITTSFDEKPISQSKNLSTKSWWEMDDESNSMDSSDVNCQTNNNSNDRNINDRRYSNDKGDKFNTKSEDSQKGFNDNEIINDFLEKPSFAKTYSSENVNDVGLNGKKDNYGDETRISNRNGRRRISKMSDFSENEEFKSFADDFINSAGANINNSVKIEIPFDDIEDENAAPSGGGFKGNSPPLTPSKRAPFGFKGMSEDDTPRQSPFPKRTLNAPRFTESKLDDGLDGEGQLPSRPTNVPYRRSFMENEDTEESVRPKFTPRPKFKRPVPLKRGAGMIYRKATPLTKSPEDVINSIMTRISTLETSKFNDHMKAQKELIDQMEKSPDVFAKLDIQLVIKIAKKIMEVAGGNRSNLARSSLICLGHMFKIFGSSLNPLIVDAMTLCAKKGVSSSPEHLVLASYFCMSTICANGLESKVSSMLVSLYRNNKAHQISCLSGMVVLMDRMSENMVRLKNLDDIVDCSVKGTTTGGVASRTASRNVLGMVQAHSKLDNHLNMCKCTEITKVSIRQLLSKYDDESKNRFIEEFGKVIAL